MAKKPLTIVTSFKIKVEETVDPIVNEVITSCILIFETLLLPNILKQASNNTKVMIVAKNILITGVQLSNKRFGALISVCKLIKKSDIKTPPLPIKCKENDLKSKEIKIKGISPYILNKKTSKSYPFGGLK